MISQTFSQTKINKMKKIKFTSFRAIEDNLITDEDEDNLTTVFAAQVETFTENFP